MTLWYIAIASEFVCILGILRLHHLAQREAA